MLRAIFFDFNGVLVDDEPLHFLLFQKALADYGILLTQDDYYKNYLGYDDKDCIQAILTDYGKPLATEEIQKIIQHKNELYLSEVEQKNLFMPGALDFVKRVADPYYLSVVSGALSSEIKAWLKFGQIDSLFKVIVAAEDVKKGKPNPEGYLRGLDQLNLNYISPTDIVLPNECLVIEDSLWGIEAAQAAGMKCLALATSYPASAIKQADWVYPSFNDIPFQDIVSQF